MIPSEILHQRQECMKIGDLGQNPRNETLGLGNRDLKPCSDTLTTFNSKRQGWKRPYQSLCKSCSDETLNTVILLQVVITLPWDLQQWITLTLSSHTFLHLPQITVGQVAATCSSHKLPVRPALHWCFGNAGIWLCWKQCKCKVLARFHFQAWDRHANVHDWGSKGNLNHEAGLI